MALLHIRVSDTGLVRCREPGPGLIRSPVIVLGIRHLYIVAEPDKDFSLSELLDSGSLAQLDIKKKIILNVGL